ncbi:hypothetical protein ES703_15833 [subsurface metagenome]
MTTSDWINLIAAILIGGGTLFLGIMAWRTIRQTRSIQKAEKRGRLLNEIIEWAIDISTCSFREDKYALANVVTIDLLLVNLAALMDRYNSARMRGEYIRIIAPVFGTNLANSVQQVITKLDEHIEVIRKYFYAEREIKLEDSAKELPEHGKFLIQSINSLIKEATKLKDHIKTTD